MADTILFWGLSLFVPGLVAADDAVRLEYKYAPGQVLQYDARHTQSVESAVGGTTRKLASQTNSVREWRVVSVDEKGNARLSLTLVRAQVEATTPDGQQLTFDSEKSESRGPLADVVGKPLVEVVLSRSGQVVELGQPQTIAAGQFAAHLRTLLFPMPDRPITVGTVWQHDLILPLPPPIGRDEKIKVRQSFRLEKVTDSVASVNLESSLAEEIKDRALMERAAQFLASGRIEFDLARGVIRGFELKVDQKVTEFAGTDSAMHVTGGYRETLKADVAGRNSNRK